MNMRLESFLEFMDTKKGPVPSAFRSILEALSWIYGFVIQTKLFLYRCKILRSKKLNCRVISVGNITCGGTGKTPAVILLTRMLKERGKKVGVLSRGYKSSEFRKRQKVSVVSDGKSLLLSPREAGDEPYLLANDLPGVPVICGKDRVTCGNYAIDKFGADTVILDDGYQYWPLHRDLNIVLIDASFPFGNGHILPRGILREHPRSLSRADLLVLTKVDQADGIAGLKERLGQINPKVPILEAIYQPLYLQDVKSGRRYDLEFLRGKKVLALSSIASPRSFEHTLKNLGPSMVSSCCFPDHHFYSEADLERVNIHASAHGAELIVTTTKDQTHIPEGLNSEMPIFVLVTDLKIIDDEHLKELLRFDL